MNNTELLIGGGKTISGIVATALGTAAVEYLLSTGLPLTATEGAGITGAIATLIGVAVKLFKLWKDKK